jgi:ABC-type nitrate/sulfonate/bicarbonate transport system permease component
MNWKKARLFAQQCVPFIGLILLWQIVSMTGIVPPFMLPSPLRVAAAFATDFSLLMRHLWRTLLEAMAGLAMAAAAAFILAVVMDSSRLIRQSLSPLLLLTQTMPTIAIAPGLILWMGYGSAPKITLVFLVCFFPMTIGLLGAFARADKDAIRLLLSMGAARRQIYRFIKLPQGLPAFFFRTENRRFLLDNRRGNCRMARRRYGAWSVHDPRQAILLVR